MKQKDENMQFMYDHRLGLLEACKSYFYWKETIDINPMINKCQLFKFIHAFLEDNKLDFSKLEEIILNDDSFSSLIEKNKTLISSFFVYYNARLLFQEINQLSLCKDAILKNLGFSSYFLSVFSAGELVVNKLQMQLHDLILKDHFDDLKSTLLSLHKALLLIDNPQDQKAKILEKCFFNFLGIDYSPLCQRQ